MKTADRKAIFKIIVPKEPVKKEHPFIKWLKRLGFAGFMFFFIKGLVWLVLIIAASYFGCKVFDK